MREHIRDNVSATLYCHCQKRAHTNTHPCKWLLKKCFVVQSSYNMTIYMRVLSPVGDALWVHIKPALCAGQIMPSPSDQINHCFLNRCTNVCSPVSPSVLKIQMIWDIHHGAYHLNFKCSQMDIENYFIQYVQIKKSGGLPLFILAAPYRNSYL